MLYPTRFCSLFLIATLVVTGFVTAYPVAYPFNLEQLNQQADVILKVTVGPSRPLTDNWFESLPGFKSVATEMEVVEVIKGKVADSRIHFQHYTQDGAAAAIYMPQHYQFQEGRTMIILAKRTEQPNVFRQCWKHHTTKEDQGSIRAVPGQRNTGTTIGQVYWAELTGLIARSQENQANSLDDVVYAINQLDRMSKNRFDCVQHFDRLQVFQQVAPLTGHAHSGVATAAISVLGNDNPFMSTDDNPFWLATHGSGFLPGIGKTNLEFVNAGGVLYGKELIHVANSDASAEVRTLAIRALGRSGTNAVWEQLPGWLDDQQLSIREAATALLGDFDSPDSRDWITKALADEQPNIRRTAAQTIGYNQKLDCVPLLESLLQDEPEVARSAALSLVSVPLSCSRDILKRQVDHPWYGTLFVNILALEDPEPWLDRLCESVESIPDPARYPYWWGGQQPGNHAWEILLGFAKQKSEMEIQGEDFEFVLQALESPITRPNTEDGIARVGSQIPVGIYELYITRNMPERAERFRKTCQQNLGYDVEPFFETVDKGR